ncbi:hypothetical protein Poli38472_001950 [Pythium oligandrum]|uniref:Uncharacterized protein n=1 Tax=Pythium oligandrum TaxID=41045 RepID=A0A8K1FQU4_PYTOL|nr:hypothetical protein Poli38472_001950 [Pythium oligandrum]|eukprot:TMW69794.1 hypothetical protein Poli38472_001950 [Pythium oligandrum]
MSSSSPDASSADTSALLAAVRGGQREALERLLGTGVQVENVVDENGDSLLHVAATRGVVAVVRVILDTDGGMSLLEKPNNDGKTPLHSACSVNKNAEVVAELLGRGANGNAVDNESRTPLHLACQAGARDMVESLVKHGVELNYLDRASESPLHYAAEKKAEDQDIGILKLLLDAGASVSIAERLGTALHRATWSNWLEAAKLLLDRGVDVNAQDTFGRTVLSVAVQQGYFDLTKLFVSHGADVNKADLEVDLPLRNAIHHPRAAEVCKLLLEHGALMLYRYGQLPLLNEAAERGNVELVKVLLAYEDKNALTPEELGFALILACLSSRTAELAQYLLELGASTTVKDNELGNTALHNACMARDAVLVKLLLSYGADPNAVNYHGYATFHTACAVDNNDEVIQLLLDRGIDADEQVSGNTALVIACYSGAVKTVEKLLAYGVNTTINREDGQSVLHIACSRDAPEVVKLLLEHGLDLNLRDESGNTPLHVAALEERSAVVQVLGQHGADAHARNEDGFTPLTMCVRWQNCEAVDPVSALETVYELMKLGAVYEDSPDNCPDTFRGLMAARPGTQEDWITYSELAASVPICIKHWTAEREAGKPLTQIPSDVAGNGGPALEREPTGDPAHLEATFLVPKTGQVPVTPKSDLTIDLSVLKETAMSSEHTQDTVTALFAAVRSGHLEDLQHLLDDQIDVESIVNEDNESLLHVAALEGRIDIVRAILEANGGGSLLEKPNSEGETPLFYACSTSDGLEVVKELLTRGANINAIAAMNRSPLMKACQQSTHEVIEFLVLSGADVNVMDASGYRALYHVCERHMIPTALFLLKCGAQVGLADGLSMALRHMLNENRIDETEAILKYGTNVDDTYPETQTVLQVAIQHGRMDFVKLFLAYGANANAWYFERERPLRLAMERPEAVELVKLLLEHGATSQWEEGELSALNAAAKTGNLELFELVLAHEDISSLTSKALGKTLIAACDNGKNVQLVQRLLELGADTETRDDDVGGTVLHHACLSGNASVVKLLLSHGADPFAVNENGHTALQVASIKVDSGEVIRLLLDRGVDANQQVSDLSPVLLACGIGNTSGAKALLAHGVDVTVTTEAGWTLLHLACKYKEAELVQALLDHGLDPNSRNMFGNTPLHITAFEGTVSVVPVLGQHGADVHARNEEGKTPLTVCVTADKRKVSNHPIRVLGVAIELMRLGAMYEASPDNPLNTFDGCRVLRPGTDSDYVDMPDATQSVAICIQHWASEQAAGKVLTEVPTDVVLNGATAVQSYLEQTTTEN